MGEVSNITIPLKTEIWQEDVLSSRFNVCRDLYNAMLGDKLRALEKMKSQPEYLDADEVIKTVQECKDASERKKLKEELGYKEAFETKRRLHMEYGFTDFGFRKIATNYRSIYADIIPTMLMQLSIAVPMWSAFDKLLNGRGESFKRGFGDDSGRARTVHFKKRDGIRSLVTDGKSGIRVLDECDKTAKKLLAGHPYHIQVSSKKGKTLNIPLKFPKNNLFLQDMLGRDIKQVRIARKMVRGRYKYDLILCVDGKPAEKRDAKGNAKHIVKTAPLGIYIDTASITIAENEDKVETIKLSAGSSLEKYDEKIKEINRKLDASRRATNPDNYNEDGTAKKGEGGEQPSEYTRLKWVYSNNYRKLRSQKSNIERVIAERRQMNANTIVHEILAKGNNIVINDMSFAAISHKFGGKTISENAPSQIVAKLTEVAERSGGTVKKVKLRADSEDRKKEDYRKDFALTMLNICKNSGDAEKD